MKPFYGYKPGVSPQYAWEPILYIGGRRRERLDLFPDFLIHNAAMSTGGRPSPHTEAQILGVKPLAFARFVFGLLNVTPERDELVDIFPGSGAVGRAWTEFQLEAKLGRDSLLAVPRSQSRGQFRGKSR